MCMLGEDEIRNWRDIEAGRIDSIVDPVERKCRRVAVEVLDGVLND